LASIDVAESSEGECVMKATMMELETELGVMKAKNRELEAEVGERRKSEVRLEEQVRRAKDAWRQIRYISGFALKNVEA